MINTNDVTSPLSETKDLTTDQTWTDLSKKTNVGGIKFSGSLGLGVDTSTSTVALINSGGYPDQKVTAVMRYSSPTTAGSEEIGVMLRILTLDGTDDTYYYARVDGGIAKLTRVLNESFTNLSTQAFALAQDTDVTITFSAVGNTLSASFDAGGTPATVNLAVSDDQIAHRGLLGIRSLSSTFWCSSVAWEQL